MYPIPPTITHHYILWHNPQKKSKYGISMNELGLDGLYERYDMGEAIVREIELFEVEELG